MRADIIAIVGILGLLMSKHFTETSKTKEVRNRSVFGLNSGFINQVQYSVLIGVVIASAVIPTFIAQKWFMPVHAEDLVDINNGNGK